MTNYKRTISDKLFIQGYLVEMNNLYSDLLICPTSNSIQFENRKIQ